jgi:peptidoglycan-N-acetylglucosamine deacetylase
MPHEPQINEVAVTDPVLALTFDDGPSEWTDLLLDAFSGRGNATFFVLGSAITGEERKTTLRRIVETGSEIGNHGFSHTPLTTLTVATIRDEIARTSSLIEEVAGVSPGFWRPPYFNVNPEVRDAVSDLGLREAGASVLIADYAHEATAEAIARGVVASPNFQPGAIVDLHDGRAPGDGDTTAPTRMATVGAVASSSMRWIRAAGVR